MSGLISVALALVACVHQARADVLYTQPPTTSGALLMSSYAAPDGSDLDEYVWDAFTLQAAGDITELRWRGGGSTLITSFDISIWASIPAGIQPDIGGMNGGRLAHYTVNGNAGQTSAGVIGGTQMYDYHYTLPRSFHAAAGTKYWIQIEGWTASWPSWGLATGSGGIGYHFHRAIAVTGDYRFYYGAGNAAFTLIGTTTACTNPTISQDPSPVEICNSAGTAVFNVVATGVGPFTYRWRQNGNPVYDGPNGGGHGGGATISGATTATLTIDMPSYWADIGTYDCVVTNGCGSTPSASATLSFSTPPSITTGPSPVATGVGGTATFTVAAASVSTPSYVWYQDGVELADGVTATGSIISGATTASIHIDNTQPGDSGLYTCSISNSCGFDSASASLAVCAADFNGDGAVDFFDYDDFVTCFEGGACPPGKTADFNGDGAVDFFDYDDFVLAFESGC